MIAQILIGPKTMSAQSQPQSQIAVSVLRPSAGDNAFLAFAIFVASVFYFYGYYYFWQGLNGMLFVPFG
jgi:Ca2+/Na+ antiporter